MRLAIGIAIILAASSWGQPPIAQFPSSNQASNFVNPAPNFIRTGEVGLAEDSPDTAETNAIFYNNPRGPQPTPVASAGTVSVEQLQHPVSSKGVKLLRKAESLSAAGRHQQAIAQLQLALKERSALPYAHSMLGGEYLRMHQPSAAIPELEQAVEMLPHDAPARCNLGVALFFSGAVARGEEEVRKAVELDRSNLKTKNVLDVILKTREAREQSAP